MFTVFQQSPFKVSIVTQTRTIFSVFRNLVTMRNTNSFSSIQELYDLCNTTFTSSETCSPSSPQDIQNLCSLMAFGSMDPVLEQRCNADTIGPADVGVQENNSEDDRGYGYFGLNKFVRESRWAQPITYIDIHECDRFTMCIFQLPTSSVIPLHDHPGMSVFSKILYGSMHVKGFDWVYPGVKKHNKHGGSTARLARLVVDEVLTAPCPTSLLGPKEGGNIHCFTAITPCAVLDVLTPPYRENAGRKCTYYHDYPYSTFASGKKSEIEDGKEEEYAWLAEIETPDIYMRSGTYAGPTIQVQHKGLI